MPWYGSHPYLNEFIRKYMCRRLLEIGVYNGENASNMVLAASKNFPSHEVEYYGFDFFSNYSVNYIERRLKETGCRYKLYKGDTMHTIAEATKTLPKMDMIFIDGGKSYREAKSDWENSSPLMHDRTGVFIHNVDFSGVRRMLCEVTREIYTVEEFYIPAEGLVGRVMKKVLTQ